MYIDIVAVIGRDTELRRVASTHGGELAGPCSLCHQGGSRTTGTDRLHVWPSQGRWACLGPRAGRNGCDLHGDAIDYLRHRDGIGYREACERLGIEPRRGRGYGGKAGESGARALRDGGKAGEDARAPGDASAPRDAGTPISTFPHPLTLSPPHPLIPPNPRWQAHGRGIVARCAIRLFRPEGARALSYLHGRGLSDETLNRYDVGYNPQHMAEPHADWGLEPPADPAQRIHVPRGITIPWFAGGALWRINVRRPVTAAQIAAGQPKYLGPSGFGNALFNADSLDVDKPVVLVEGEIDALTVAQACREAVGVVATGSTAGGRREEWIDRLRAAPCVLVAFDHDENGAGDKAAGWWLSTLPNARRWLPLTHDVNSSPQPLDVQRWVEQGLAYIGQQTERSS